MSRPCRKTNAFTLLEVLLAISVAAMLISAAAFMTVGLTNIWARRTQMDSFQEHADGVAGFLQDALRQSVSRIQPAWVDKDSNLENAAGKADTPGDNKKGDDSGANASTKAKAQIWQGGLSMSRCDENDSIERPKLHFQFFNMPALLGADAPPASPGVEAWLAFDTNKGLGLIWKDTRSVQKRLVSDDKDLMRSCLLSSHVVKIEYIYLKTDDRKWEIVEDEPRQYAGNYPMPDLIRLTFRVDERETTRTLLLPRSGRSMPLY